MLQAVRFNIVSATYTLASALINNLTEPIYFPETISGFPKSENPVLQ